MSDLSYDSSLAWWVADGEVTDASGVSMAPPLLGLTYAGTSVGDPVTLVVLVGVFLVESSLDDALVVPGGEVDAAASGGGPAVASGGDLQDPYLVS